MGSSERKSMELDVVYSRGGAAGLSAAIRLGRVDPDLTVVGVRSWVDRSSRGLTMAVGFSEREGISVGRDAAQFVETA